MNTTAKALVFAIVTVASAASIGMSLADRKAKTETVKLERVVIVGKRAEPSTVIAQLPRVVITGRSAAHGDVQLAAAKLVKVI